MIQSICERITREVSTLLMEGFEVKYVILGAEEYRQLKHEIHDQIDREIDIKRIATPAGYTEVVKKIRTTTFFEFGE